MICGDYCEIRHELVFTVGFGRGDKGAGLVPQRIECCVNDVHRPAVVFFFEHVWRAAGSRALKMYVWIMSKLVERYCRGFNCTPNNLDTLV